MAIDILFTSVPLIDTDEPMMAPAVLKGAVKAAGFTSAAIDLNAEIRNVVSKKHLVTLERFCTSELVNPSDIPVIVEAIQHCTNRIKSFQPKILGVSLLCYQSQIFTKWLLVNIQAECPGIKVVIGGSGIKTELATDNNTFCDELKSCKLIDDYIVGDGEVSVVEYLKGNLSYPGINSTKWNKHNDLNTLPWADYDDYDFSIYETPCIPIVDSRGCIRNCEFCNIIEFWDKYQYRSAEVTFAEILYQTKKHNIFDIRFRNALTNGNMKEFSKLAKLFADYNQQPENIALSWAGYFIVRSKGSHSDQLWEDIGKGNGTLWLGVESLIDDVRIRLGKKFSNDDLEYHITQAKKYNVILDLLLIVAYPTETRADYAATKQWLIDHAPYAKTTIRKIMLNYAAILPGTKLESKKAEYGVDSGKNPFIWINQNLNISAEERVNHYLELNQLCIDLGFINPCSFEHTLEVVKDNATM